MKKPLLQYHFPEDLKTMTDRELSLLSYEIRDFLIEKVSKTGGHLASSLGATELAVCLHAFFNTPEDRIIWDVGHQAYAHKILTGRAAGFDSLRQADGMSGFPKRSESKYDQFDSGHASTSISAALGMAKARDLNGENYEVIAVIGDGSMTGGTALEGLNHAGYLNTRLIVILNDNQMSIGRNMGAINQHLSKLRVSKPYLNLKKSIKNALQEKENGSTVYSKLERLRDSVKYAVLPGCLFEEMGFSYFGPVDGHNITELKEALTLAKAMKGPVLIHAVTKKGKGYVNAERYPEKFHGTGPFDPSTGRCNSAVDPHTGRPMQTFTDVFGAELVQLAKNDPTIVAISAAMIDGTGLKPFQSQFPERCFDVGIAEEHAVSFAAGLALSGMKPVVTIYSTFLQRAYDQMMIDVCMQNLPVVFMLDRAGHVGSDGETHHGVFDLSYLNSMPNLTILMPADAWELRQMLHYALQQNCPVAIRYPRGAAIERYSEKELLSIEDGAVCLSEGENITIVSAGKMLGTALKVGKLLEERGISAEIIDSRFMKPLDWPKLALSFEKTQNVITIEDNVLSGGFGSAVASFLTDRDSADIRLLRFAWPNAFLEQGPSEIIMKRYGLDAESIAERTVEFLEGTS